VGLRVGGQPWVTSGRVFALKSRKLNPVLSPLLSLSLFLSLRLTEALSVTIFVGFSVDYALHLAQAYRNAPFQDRHLKLRQGMLEVSDYY
jgi:hypothetical protein